MIYTLNILNTIFFKEVITLSCSFQLQVQVLAIGDLNATNFGLGQLLQLF